MKQKAFHLVIYLLLAGLFALPSFGALPRVLTGHVPKEIRQQNLQPQRRLLGSDRLTLVLGLPLHDQEALTNLLNQMYDPAGTNFHNYLTPEQFTARFGPTPQEYQKVIDFANGCGFEIKSTSADRVLLEVAAPVSNIESAFHVNLHAYQHPVEARQFIAPDVEPAVDAGVPIVHISGLNTFFKPHPAGLRKSGFSNGVNWGGTAPDGSAFIGSDFRKAYASGVTQTGAGQSVGLVEFEGYFTSDMTAYETNAGISQSFPLQNVVLPGFTFSPTDTNGIGECSLDIEMVMAMAPGLSKLYVFEAGGSDQVLMSMVASNTIKQFSTSWGMTDDPMTEGYLMQMALQGQSFFGASGDGDAYVGANAQNNWPCAYPYITSVGGTTLTMAAGSYVSETVWNSRYQPPDPWFGNGQTTNDPYWGSCGGVSTVYSIPSWQVNANPAGAGGSSTMRNLPDIAMTGNQVWVNFSHETGDFEGTSCAAPLWAGFCALANQAAVSQGLTPLGFLNPALYSIAQTARYTNCFHDITTGDNTWPGSPNLYYAQPGYDLCTGLGTPNGINLINALMPFSGAVWVDFNYSGTPNNGTYNFPFKTLAQGTNAVVSGGNIWIRSAGSSSEKMTITKPLSIRAYNGAATIGH
ncbi:MAG TPA: S53 family peptidase [Verrucomicrobiae bacterium]|nr:S53 family peptidase [Verrucomicrobiae bacterium]